MEIKIGSQKNFKECLSDALSPHFVTSIAHAVMSNNVSPPAVTSNNVSPHDMASDDLSSHDVTSNALSPHDVTSDALSTPDVTSDILSPRDVASDVTSPRDIASCLEHDGRAAVNQSINENSETRMKKLDENFNLIERHPASSKSLSNSIPRVNPDECEYNMGHRRRGLCVILQNTKFDPEAELSVRTGSGIDCIRVRKTFRKLGFEVSLHNNKSAKDILEIVTDVSRMDHSDCDCLAVVILSHGNDGVIYGRDKEICIDDLLFPFKGNRCSTLVGKPKLFFIQACRGNLLDDGANVISDGDDEVDSATIESKQILKIPNEADIAIVYSTVSGYSSWRLYGSCFIQALCEMLDKHWSNMDLLKILTRVNRKVAYDFESKSEDNPERHGKKQMPCQMTTLTKELFFAPK